MSDAPKIVTASGSPYPVQPVRPAATVIIARDGDADRDGVIEMELFMLRRGAGAAFAGGMYVFPGGRVESDDHLHAWDAVRTGPSPAQGAQVAAVGNEWRGFWIAAIRETFEESGLLLAYDSDGALLAWRDDAHEARYEALRHDVHEGRVDLLEFCHEEGLTLACGHVHYFNRWITPLGRPRRFDTRFFIAEAPPGQTGLHDDKELDDSLWITPKRALERHAEGDFGLMGVTERQLRTLVELGSVAALHDWALSRDDFPVFRPVLPPGK
jgi:8-oxo-dGTP pyrophosphatase MutT (NUDIX family)